MVEFYLMSNRLIIILLMLKLQQQVDQLTQYIRTILLEGVDISALYIIEAQLTMLRNSLQPRILLQNLFSTKDLVKMVTLTKKSFSSLKMQEYHRCLSDNTVEGDIMLKFKLSCKRFDVNPIKDLRLLSSQILQTLEEWKVAADKAQIFHQRMQKVSDYNGAAVSEEHLPKQLDLQLCLLERFADKKQIKLLTETTESYSSLSEQDQPLCKKKIEVNQITSFFQYIIRWNNQIQQEIADFKDIIEITKEESSVDLQTSFSRDVQYFSKPKQENKERYLPLPVKGTKQTKKTAFSSLSLNRKILSELDCTSNRGRSGRDQIFAQRSNETCTKCDIY